MATEDAQFVRIIRELQVRFTRYYTVVLASHHLTLPQYGMLSLLYHDGAAPMNQIAVHLMISLPAVTKLADRLERAKFVKRVPHASDRRVKLIQLTSKGNEIVEKTQGLMLRVVVENLAQFTENEQTAIKKFYAQLVLHLEEQLREKRGK